MNPVGETTSTTSTTAGGKSRNAGRERPVGAGLSSKSESSDIYEVTLAPTCSCRLIFAASTSLKRCDDDYRLVRL